jgi:hypothetical protein
MVLFYEIRNKEVVNKNILGAELNQISKFIWFLILLFSIFLLLFWGVFCPFYFAIVRFWAILALLPLKIII